MPTWEEQLCRVAQAQGMVSAQVECTVDDALTLMHERADVQRVTLHQIADAVVERRLRFDASRT